MAVVVSDTTGRRRVFVVVTGLVVEIVRIGGGRLEVVVGMGRDRDRAVTVINPSP